VRVCPAWDPRKLQVYDLLHRTWPTRAAGGGEEGEMSYTISGNESACLVALILMGLWFPG
jgi:hypothetical protein